MKWKRRREETSKLQKKKKREQDEMPCANTFQGAFVKEIIST